MQLSQGLAPTPRSAPLVNRAAICHHSEPLGAPRLQEETNTFEAKTPRQGKENRTVCIPSDDFPGLSSLEEELEMVPAELFYFPPRRPFSFTVYRGWPFAFEAWKFQNQTLESIMVANP